MKKFIVAILFFILTFAITPAFALYGNYDEFVSDILPEQKTPMIIPKGSIFRGLMGENVSSEFNNSGDRVKILITSDYILDNKVLVPKNSLFIAEIKNLQKAEQGRNGFFQLDIIGLIFPDERVFRATGYIVANNKGKIFGGEFSRRSGYKTTLHRSACFGGKGAMEMQGNGPRVMGKETFIRTGDIVTIILEEPINTDI